MPLEPLDEVQEHEYDGDLEDEDEQPVQNQNEVLPSQQQPTKYLTVSWARRCIYHDKEEPESSFPQHPPSHLCSHIVNICREDLEEHIMIKVRMEGKETAEAGILCLHCGEKMHSWDVERNTRQRPVLFLSYLNLNTSHKHDHEILEKRGLTPGACNRAKWYSIDCEHADCSPCFSRMLAQEARRQRWLRIREMKNDGGMLREVVDEVWKGDAAGYGV